MMDGAEILYVEAEDDQFAPAPSECVSSPSWVDWTRTWTAGLGCRNAVAADGTRTLVPEFVQNQALLQRFLQFGSSAKEICDSSPIKIKRFVTALVNRC